MSRDLKYKQIPSRALVQPNKILDYTNSLGLSNTTEELYECGENITALTPVYLSGGKMFIADSVPCEFISITAGNLGEYIECKNTDKIPYNSLSGDVWNVSGALSKYVKSDFEQRIGRVLGNYLYLDIELGTWNKI